MFLRRILMDFILSDENPPKKTRNKRVPKKKVSFNESVKKEKVPQPIVPPSDYYDDILKRQGKYKAKKPSNKSTKQKHKRDRIPSDIRNNVWVTYHGETSEGICYCCGVVIQRYHAGWHCSHVVAQNKCGDEIIENLRTCCRHCNLSMGNQNLYAYIQEKGLKGPGSKNVRKYLQQHPSQRFDKRTNNWGH